MADTPAAAGERTILASPFPAAGGRVLVSPFQFLVTGEDNLRIEGWSAVDGATLSVAYRFADTKGKIIANTVHLALTGDRLVRELDVKLGEGYLVNMSIFMTGVSPLVGQVFTCIKLIRGFTGATIILGLLAQGYITHEQGIGWPGSPLVTSLDTLPVPRLILGTEPAPGSEIAETVPTGARWQVVSVRFTLTTDATAANRTVRLRFNTSGTEAFRVPGGAVQTASLAVLYNFAVGVTRMTSSVGGVQNLPLPSDLWLNAASQVQTISENLQAGDDYTQPQLFVREQLEAS